METCIPTVTEVVLAQSGRSQQVSMQVVAIGRGHWVRSWVCLHFIHTLPTRISLLPPSSFIVSPTLGGNLGGEGQDESSRVNCC